MQHTPGLAGVGIRPRVWVEQDVLFPAMAGPLSPSARRRAGGAAAGWRALPCHAGEGGCNPIPSPAFFDLGARFSGCGAAQRLTLWPQTAG